MSRDFFAKPLWSTAVVAALLLGAITTAVSTTWYLASKFGAVESRLTVVETQMGFVIKAQEKEQHAERRQLLTEEQP